MQEQTILTCLLTAFGSWLKYMFLQPLWFPIHLSSDLSETTNLLSVSAHKPQCVKQKTRVKQMSCHFALLFTSLCLILQIINLIDFFFQPPFCHLPFLMLNQILLLSSPPSFIPTLLSSFSVCQAPLHLPQPTIPFTGI